MMQLEQACVPNTPSQTSNLARLNAHHGHGICALYEIGWSRALPMPHCTQLLATHAVGSQSLGSKSYAAPCRVLDEGIDITLEGCLKASHSRAPDATVRQPPFLDTYAHRALCFSGVARAELLSSVSTGATTHVQRHAATLHNGEEVILTFRLARETTVRAAYKGLASEPQWVLERAWGEYARLQVRTRHADVSPISAGRSHRPL